MSRRNRNRQFSQAAGSSLPAANSNLAEEYHLIRHDLLRVLVVNVLFLAGVLALYYTNMRSHYLERWFERLLNF